MDLKFSRQMMVSPLLRMPQERGYVGGIWIYNAEFDDDSVRWNDFLGILRLPFLLCI